MVHADIIPKSIEAFFDLIRTHGFEVVAQEVFEAHLLVLCQIGSALEKAVAGFFQNGLVAFLGEFFGFLFAHFVDGFAELFGDMEAVKDVEGVRQNFADDFEVGTPHVGAYVLDGVALFLVEGVG